MSSDANSFEVGLDFPSVLQAISKQIYDTPHAFIRENIQNAIDAVRIQALRDNVQTNEDQYCIEISIDDRTVKIRDHGIGMSEKELQNYFWTIGASGKRNKEAQDAGCVGMFGIGGFANFGVCDSLEVTSQTRDSSTGTLTRLSATDIQKAGATNPSVTVQQSNMAGPRGTIVIGLLRQTPNIEDLKQYLKGFVRFVPIPIKFNGERISQQSFEDVDDRDNLKSIEGIPEFWGSGDIAITGRLYEDRGHTLVAAIEGLTLSGEQIKLMGQLRFENGRIDVFKRGFKLCSTQIPSTIGISGRLDCDQFVPTAGRDSLHAETSSLLSQIVRILENTAIDVIFSSSDRITQHTRLFRLIVKRNLIDKMDNVLVRLADGTEKMLANIKRSANDGDVGVFYGTTQKQALNQVMQARGHIVIQLSADRYRREAEKKYLDRYCAAKPFDGIVDCTEIYDNITRFERVFLSEIEQNISNSYELTDFKLVAGRLTEDIPIFVRERSGNQPIEIFVDVRHREVTKLSTLGLNPLVYSLISLFCSEYIGPYLKKWSPRFFGDGALNLERFAKKRSELWLLIKDDISVIRKGGQRQTVTKQDVQVIHVGNQQVQSPPASNQTHRLLQVIDEDHMTDLAGYYIRLLDSAFRAYGDLLPGCDSYGVVWAGNKMTFTASDGVSAQFQYVICLDEIISTEIAGTQRAEGALEPNRPLQEIYGSVYFPIPAVLERFLVPVGNNKIRLDLRCEWIDMRSSKSWDLQEPNTEPEVVV